ncbi:MAG: hypothetical protein F9K40_21405 [Kofleriaceae bacterium]|nr:MAG: hypothetical protein F9K40_21405 [Kofleriaceae bacterium]
MVRDELRQDEQSDLESKPPGVEMRFAPEITEAAKVQKLAPGDADEESCIAREPIELASLNAHFREGDTHHVHLRQILCIGLAERWYALRIF